MAEAPVHVVPYDPSWPAQFQREKAEIERILAPWVTRAIEHVGSTAVVGLVAKPARTIARRTPTRSGRSSPMRCVSP